MKYLCINCNYIYDEAIWDSVDGIPAWTKIEDLNYCPSCQEIDTFNHINEEITYIDEDTVDKIDLEHDIQISHDNFRIEVTVWWNSHPMWDDHRIAWVALFDEYSDLIEEKFLWIDDDSFVVFNNYDLDEFEIRVKCTQHQTFAKKFVI